MTLSVFYCLWYGCHLGVVLLMAFNGLGVSSPVISAQKYPRRPPLGRDLHHGPLQWRTDDLEAQGLLTQLLSTLNLTEQGPHRTRPSTAPKETADYMLELYNQFADDFSAVPSASIVRSFKNQDSSPYRVTAGGTQTHPLLFDISVPHHEHVRLAELRLYTAVRRSISSTHSAIDRMVTVYKIHEGVLSTKEAVTGERRRGDQEVVLEMERLATKRIHAKGHNWMSFDLTHAMKMWLSSGCVTHRLEVHVEKRPRTKEEEVEEEEEGDMAAEVTKEEEEEEEEEEGGTSVDVIIERNVEGKRNAVIVVFSDDPGSDRKQDRKEPSQKTEDENLFPDNLDQHMVWEAVNENEGHTSQKHPDKQSHQHQHQPVPSSRIRRSAKSEPCKRAPLYVDFKDIGWDQWVIQPLGYEAYECNGVCSMPMTSEVSPTKHAMVQTLLSLRRPQRASRACCVPTKLDSIPLLYYDNSVVTLNPKYEGMVVAECGCR
ncbi:unnamed protein product [Lota lota]